MYDQSGWTSCRLSACFSSEINHLQHKLPNKHSSYNTANIRMTLSHNEDKQRFKVWERFLAARGRAPNWFLIKFRFTFPTQDALGESRLVTDSNAVIRVTFTHTNWKNVTGPEGRQTHFTRGQYSACFGCFGLVLSRCQRQLVNVSAGWLPWLQTPETTVRSHKQHFILKLNTFVCRYVWTLTTRLNVTVCRCSWCHILWLARRAGCTAEHKATNKVTQLKLNRSIHDRSLHPRHSSDSSRQTQIWWVYL